MIRAQQSTNGKSATGNGNNTEKSFLEKTRQEYRAQLNKIKEDSFKSVTMDTVKERLQQPHTGILQW